MKYEDKKEWKTIDRRPSAAASKFNFKDKVGSVRDRKYRVFKPAGAQPQRRVAARASR